MIKCSLFVLALAFIGTAGASFTLEDFCKGQPVELKFIRDVEFLITSFMYGPAPGCSERTRESILDLEPIIHAENVCSEDVAKKIGQYYAKYVSKMSIINHWLLSKSTREFFLAMSFEISRVCEKALMDKLSAITKERISLKEGVEMSKLNDDLNDIVSKVGSGQMRIQDLFLVTDMDGIVAIKRNAPKINTKSTVGMKPVSKKRFDRVEALCRNKFKPVYEKLFTPLVMLTNVGFEYTSGYVNKHRPVFKDSYDYKTWYTGVLLCQAVLAQNVNEAPGSSIEIGHDLEEDTDSDLGEQPISNTRQEFDLRVRLDLSTNFASDELRQEAKTFADKREEAKKSRKLVYERLMKN